MEALYKETNKNKQDTPMRKKEKEQTFSKSRGWGLGRARAKGKGDWRNAGTPIILEKHLNRLGLKEREPIPIR
jgi:hypothetical protein